MKDDENKFVIIATNNCQKALYVISKDAMRFDVLDLHFTEKFAPTVEYLLRTLRKAFGWMEIYRGTKEVKNTKCLYNVDGFCGCENKKQDKSTANKIRCTEGVRMSCEDYKQRSSRSMTVNYVTIEKAGQIRNM